MESNQYDVFISYRRKNADGSDGVETARSIQKELQLHGYKVFFDYSEIKNDLFEKKIFPAIHDCKVFLLVLTHGSLDRCVNEDDWVRREIHEAILTHQRNSSLCSIVPVNIDNSFVDWPSDLPSELSPIKGFQISNIHSDSTFEVTIEKLIKDRLPTLKKEISPVFTSPDNAQNNFIRGEYFYNGWLGFDKDPAKAIDFYMKAARQGNAKAQCKLGICYYKGQGVEQNYDKALEWFLMASDQNDAESLYYIGMCYQEGRGVSKDRTEAARWFRRGAELGNPDAQNQLGFCYLHGMGVGRDVKEAYAWLKKSADAGNIDSQIILGEILSGKRIQCGFSDKAKAMEWFLKASYGGDEYAQGELLALLDD